jgi:membrane protein YqaA with SNARE-associated domain
LSPEQDEYRLLFQNSVPSERIRVAVLHEHVSDLIRTYGYPGIFVLLFVENFGIPVPGQPVFVVAILLAGRGELQLVPVAIIAWTASVLGGFVGFAIGRSGGHRLLERYGGYIWITPERLKKAEGFFSHYGGGVIVLARFFEGTAANLRNTRRQSEHFLAVLYCLQSRGRHAVGRRLDWTDAVVRPPHAPLLDFFSRQPTAVLPGHRLRCVRGGRYPAHDPAEQSQLINSRRHAHLTLARNSGREPSEEIR